MTGERGDRPEGVEYWTVDELKAVASTVLDTGDSDVLRAFDGRWVGVLASPATTHSKHTALGMSVLPAGYTTPVHSHEAEEVAVVLEGKGAIEVDGELINVTSGSVVFTPSNLPHRTVAENALVILWLYSPAGSELRWMS